MKTLAPFCTENRLKKNDAINQKSSSLPIVKLVRSTPERIINDPESLKLVAQTAATLSHEINNPLMAISGIVERLLQSESEMSPGILEKVRQIGVAAARIRSVTEQLMEIDALYLRHTAAGLMIDLDRLLRPLSTDLTSVEHKK